MTRDEQPSLYPEIQAWMLHAEQNAVSMDPTKLLPEEIHDNWVLDLILVECFDNHEKDKRPRFAPSASNEMANNIRNPTLHGCGDQRSIASYSHLILLIELESSGGGTIQLPRCVVSGAWVLSPRVRAEQGPAMETDLPPADLELGVREAALEESL